MNSAIPVEIRSLARMMTCPQCKGKGSYEWDGKTRICSYCGGDKVVSRSIMRKIAKEHGYDLDTFIEKTYGPNRSDEA